MKQFILALGLGGTLFSCSDFDEVNVDPKAADISQVQVEYVLNDAIIGAQMDPHIAERVYVLYWKTASRQHRTNGVLAWGDYNDDWSSDYYRYLSGWLKSANLAVKVAKEKMEGGSAFPYTSNMMQMARIWRVYLMSEFTDNFGPMPIDAFKGENPSFDSEKDVYYHMLAELEEAVASIDESVVPVPEENRKFDQAYGFDYGKWIKYGNSLRLRLAMRLSEVDPAKAQSEFEAVANEPLIVNAADAFQVAERSGWDALTGVMSREWNAQLLSTTMNNLYIGLGGITSASMLPPEMHSQIKPANYMGLKLEQHITSMTNDPSAGFWYDGLHERIDPRAYKAFIVPGYFTNPDFCFYPSWSNDARNLKRNLLDENSNPMKEIDATYTWNAAPLGAWGTKSARNQVSTYVGTNPRLALKFRNSTSKRIFFANWETHFLLAEGALRGWSTPVSAKIAYENGVKASFDFWGISSMAEAYLSSNDYNRVGTSANFDHTTEPTATLTMDYTDGYTGAQGVHTFKYPVNHLYKNGSVKNDQMTKVITQKYLAQLPWLPLEAWSDHRRMGLPFFENPAVDQPIVTLPDLNSSNYTMSKVQFFGQRLKYPSSLVNSSPVGYQQAVGFIGGKDEVLTPLWWAKKP